MIFMIPSNNKRNLPANNRNLGRARLNNDYLNVNWKSQDLGKVFKNEKKFVK